MLSFFHSSHLSVLAFHLVGHTKLLTWALGYEWIYRNGFAKRIANAITKP